MKEILLICLVVLLLAGVIVYCSIKQVREWREIESKIEVLKIEQAAMELEATVPSRLQLINKCLIESGQLTGPLFQEQVLTWNVYFLNEGEDVSCFLK